VKRSSVIFLLGLVLLAFPLVPTTASAAPASVQSQESVSTDSTRSDQGFRLKDNPSSPDLRRRIRPIPTPTPTPAPYSLNQIALGVYEPAGNVLAYGTAVQNYAAEAGNQPAFAWFSVKWQNAKTGAYQQFDPRLLDQFRTLGIMPGLNWDASRGPALNTNQPDFSWKTIISGKHDAYIQQWAASAAGYHYPFLLRVLEEMDGNWYPWGYSVNGNTNPADFVAAWKHIVDIFRQAGATNVQFVYCQSSRRQTQINNQIDILKQAYPGDAYVDWIALDGYANSRNNWRSLKDQFQPSYDLLTSLSSRPMIFYEVGAAENPNDPLFKANWITQGFLTTIPQQFPRVVAAGWFDSVSDNGVYDYSLDTSQNSLNAWRQVVASPLYQVKLSP
jgi:mannan endo-1,4-beta-mannosidase